MEVESKQKMIRHMLIFWQAPPALPEDVIGRYCFGNQLQIGDMLLFGDMAIYSTCKNNTFNGMPLPDIWKRTVSGTLEKLTDFGYEDFWMRLGRSDCSKGSRYKTPLSVLTADTTKLTPQNGSFTSGFDRGRYVVTAVAKNPALVCAWLDQMYDPMQSPQNNWGTYGEDDDFDIFELGTNDAGEEMLKHAPLGDASPVEVREAESVGGPLAILDLLQTEK